MTALQLAHKMTSLINEAYEAGYHTFPGIHNVSREEFDKIDVKEDAHGSFDDPYWHKSLEMNGRRISIFCNEPPVKDDD